MPHLRFGPVAAADDGRRFVAISAGQAPVFPKAGPPEHRAEDAAGGSGDETELVLDLDAQGPDLRHHRWVRVFEPVLHGPEDRGVSVPQRPGFAVKALAHAQVRMVLVAHPALKGSAANPKETGAVALEVPAESRVDELLRLFARNGGMLEIETVLPVDVRQVDIIQQPALQGHLVVERRARNRRVEHELVEVGLVRDGALDLFADVLRRVMLQPQNGGAEKYNAVLPQLASQLQRVGAF